MKTTAKIIFSAVIWSLLTLSAFAQANLPGKVYVSEVNGAVTFIVNGRTVALKKGASILVEGAHIETAVGASLVLVYSNGSSIYIDENTIVDVRRFVQKPFTPGVDTTVMEPSISETIAKVTQGRVVISTNELATGSSMIYQTPESQVRIRGKEVVIEVQNQSTNVILMNGDVTVTPVNAPPGDIGQSLQSGQMAVVTSTSAATTSVPTIQVAVVSQVLTNELAPMFASTERAQSTVIFESVTPTGAGADNATPVIQAQAIVPANLPVQLTENPASFTIAPTSFTYNGSAQGPTITRSPADATYDSSGTASATNAGSYSVTATATGNYTGTSGATAWTVAKATPVITWPTPGAITYGTALSTTQLNATASVPGTFAYSPAGGTVLAAGTQTLSVTFTPTDAANYNSVTSTVAHTVAKAALTITANDASRAYGAANPAFSASYTGLVNGDTSAVVSGLTLTTAATTASNAGPYPITAAGATATNYTLTLVNGTLTVTAVPTTFALSQTSFIYNGAAQGPTITPSPAGASFTTGGTLSATAIGSYTATATATGNYTGANTSLAWSIVSGSQTITFPDPGPQTYGTPLTLAATASSGLPVAYTVTGPATLAGSTVTFSGAGSITITAAQAGNGSYGAAPDVSRTFTVAKAALTITANDASRAYGAANPTLTASYTGLVNGDTSAVVSGLTLTTTAATASNAGTYPITAAGATATNYTLTLVNGTLTVSPATQAAVTSASGSVTYGSTFLAAGAGGSGTGAYNFQLIAGGTASGGAVTAGGVVSATSAGTVLFQAQRLGDTNYPASAWSDTYTATFTARAITVTLTGSKPYDDTTTATGASASVTTGSLASGDTISYAFAATSSANAGSYSGLTTATVSNPGSYAITYAGSYTISQATQAALTVSATPTTVPYGSSSSLSTSGGSGIGAVTYTADTGGTISGASFTATAAAGPVTITATKAADGNYTSASATTTLTLAQAPTTFTITPVTLTYTGSAQGPTITPSPAAATWAVTSGTASATTVGSYSVTATATGNYTGTSGATPWTIAKAEQPAPTFSTYSALYNVTGTYNYDAPPPTNTGYGNLGWSLGSGSSAPGATVDPDGDIHCSDNGTVVVTASYAGDANHLPSPASANYTVTVQFSVSPHSLF
jgi:hypothetical protein